MIRREGYYAVCHHIVKPSVRSSYMALHDISVIKYFTS